MTEIRNHVTVDLLHGGLSLWKLPCSDSSRKDSRNNSMRFVWTDCWTGVQTAGISRCASSCKDWITVTGNKTHANSWLYWKAKLRGWTKQLNWKSDKVWKQESNKAELRTKVGTLRHAGRRMSGDPKEHGQRGLTKTGCKTLKLLVGFVSGSF